MILPRGSVDGSRNAKHFKTRQGICVFIVFIRHGQLINGIYGKGTETNQVGQPQGFIAVEIIQKSGGTKVSMEGNHGKIRTLNKPR